MHASENAHSGADMHSDMLQTNKLWTVARTRAKWYGRWSALCGVFNLDALANHPGIIYLPYTYGTANFYEVYTMAVPMFCPSLDLLERNSASAPWCPSAAR